MFVKNQPKSIRWCSKARIIFCPSLKPLRCCRFFENCLLSIHVQISVQILLFGICKMLHKIRKQSKHHLRFFSAQNYFWSSSGQVMEYLNAFCNVYCWHVETAQTDISVKQISETIGIEFRFLWRTCGQACNRMLLLAFHNFSSG